MAEKTEKAEKKDQAAKTEKNKAKTQREPLPIFEPGDMIKVYHKIYEGDKERIQTFQGTVLQIRGVGESKSFTVRKMSRGIGVERIFPITSPMITKIEVKKHSKVRRAKLFYLRGRKGRAAKLKEHKIETESRPKAVEK